MKDVKIWFGVKYSCDGWDLTETSSDLMFIPKNITGEVVNGVRVCNGTNTSYNLSEFGTGKWKLKPVNKWIKDTPLARKMYHQNILSEKDGFLEVSCE